MKLPVSKPMAITFVVYALFAMANFFFISKITTYGTTLYIVGAVIISGPTLIYSYFQSKRVKDLEGNFPVFLQDFVETMRGGMTLPQAFKTISDNKYSILTPYVKKMAAQLEWGIPVEKVLTNFAKETKSSLISRIVTTVMESHKFGGKLIDTFEALSKSAIEVERLREERKLYLNSQIVTGYIIFFVFLVVILGLQKYLVPSLGTVSTQTITQGTQPPNSNLGAEYNTIFRNLIIMQGLFAGLTVGKMAEGSVAAGIKHSAFMMTVGILVFLIFG